MRGSKLTTKEKYEVVKVSDTKLKFRKVNPNAKHITLIFFYKHNNYKDTYGKKCEKISIILSIMLR